MNGISALKITMLHTNERCAAGGTADDTTEPVLTVVAWAGMIAPAGLDFCHASLNGIPKVFIDDRLVLSANGQNIRVIIVAAAAALWIPSQHTDIDGVS